MHIHKRREHWKPFKIPMVDGAYFSIFLDAVFLLRHNVGYMGSLKIGNSVKLFDVSPGISYYIDFSVGFYCGMLGP